MKEIEVLVELYDDINNTSSDVDIKEEKNKIQEFINDLNIKVSEELNMGKPEMYLKKHKIKVD